MLYEKELAIFSYHCIIMRQDFVVISFCHNVITWPNQGLIRLLLKIRMPDFLLLLLKIETVLVLAFTDANQGVL